MKKLLVIILFLSNAAIAQKMVQTGIVYKQHPNIEIIKKVAALYEKGDADGMARFFDDKVQFIGMSRYVAGVPPKNRSLNEAKSGWQHIIDNWDDLKMTETIPPVGLQYANGSFIVQSWWLIKVVNKKTRKRAEVDMVLFDEFNKRGKIIAQRQYYDPAPLIDAAK
jgi:hypothetical protein